MKIKHTKRYKCIHTQHTHNNNNNNVHANRKSSRMLRTRMHRNMENVNANENEKADIKLCSIRWKLTVWYLHKQTDSFARLLC